MAVGLLTLHLLINGSHSLKEKRQVLRSLKDRLRHRHNVSVAELDYQDSWQRAVIGVAAVSPRLSQLEELLQRIADEAADQLGADLTGTEVEVW